MVSHIVGLTRFIHILGLKLLFPYPNPSLPNPNLVPGMPRHNRDGNLTSRLLILVQNLSLPFLSTVGTFPEALEGLPVRLFHTDN